jgi:cytochrome c biogenesis protein CcmG, thiol:disulfide interchange protein DsbE
MPRRWGLVLIPVIAVAAVAYYWLFQRPSSVPVLGRPAPSFQLQALNGAPTSLADYRGKPVIVNFWATWCEPCRAEMPLLSALYDHLQAQDLVVLSITDEDGLKAAQFLGGTKYHPSVLLDPGGKVHKQFHIQSIPATFIFDRDGKLVGETIDQGSPRLFLRLLSKANLQP